MPSFLAGVGQLSLLAKLWSRLTYLVDVVRYCAVNTDNSDVLYIVADAFREKLSQILGRELRVVTQFDGDLPVTLRCIEQLTMCYMYNINPARICT